MLKKIDLVIAPAVGFDKSLNRLGRGKGYYDSFFKKLSVHTKKIGLAFRFQILNNLPTSSFDQPVDKIIFA
jgi:5-formyltetrahydrofolate cyclo-ligase